MRRLTVTCLTLLFLLAALGLSCGDYGARDPARRPGMTPSLGVRPLRLRDEGESTESVQVDLAAVPQIVASLNSCVDRIEKFYDQPLHRRPEPRRRDPAGRRARIRSRAAP